jgi:hypothetical protein
VWYVSRERVLLSLSVREPCRGVGTGRMVTLPNFNSVVDFSRDSELGWTGFPEDFPGPVTVNTPEKGGFLSRFLKGQFSYGGFL